MIDIRHAGVCDAPVDVAFRYLNDYRNATSWMFGLARFEPVGEPSQGLGAVFDGTFHVTPVKLHSTIEVTQWVEHSLIAFRSIKGFPNKSTWRFFADGPQLTRIEVLFSYELPGGLAGRALGRALEPIVALSIRQSDDALRRNIAAVYHAN